MFSMKDTTCSASSPKGFSEFTSTRNGFPILCNSCIAFFSACRKLSLDRSPKLPSPVMTMPTVACSRITLSVPMEAASVKGISFLSQGVFTIRTSPFSPEYPSAPSTTYPTQSTIRRLTVTPSPRLMAAAFLGTNLGSTVVIVLPIPLVGSSSLIISSS